MKVQNYERSELRSFERFSSIEKVTIPSIESLYLFFSGAHYFPSSLFFRRGISICSTMPSSAGRDKDRSQLPTVQEICDIRSALVKDGVSKTLLREKKIPETLLIAAKRGVREEGSIMTSTKSLVDALLQIVVDSSSDQTGQPRRNPESHGQKNKADRLEAETASRAAKWAIDLLAECVNEKMEDSASFSTNSEGKIFVAPRDTLEKSLVRTYSEYVILKARQVLEMKDPALRVPVDRAIQLLAPVSTLPWCNDLFSELLSLRWSMVCVRAKTDNAVSLNPFASLRSIEKDFEALMTFSEESAIATSLLVGDDCEKFMTQVQKVFIEDCKLNSERGKQVVQLISTAACGNLELHWYLMDQVRDNISSGPSFSYLQWELRSISRALLSETLNRLISFSSDVNRGQEEGSDVITYRFPPHARTLVRRVVTAARSLTNLAQESRFEIAKNLLNYLGNLLIMNDSPRLSRNLQATLICLEGVLEKLVWTTLYQFGQSMRTAREASRLIDNEVLFRSISAISASLNYPRDTCRSLAKSQAKVKRYFNSLSKFLEATWESKAVVYRNQDNLFLMGTMSAAVAGLLSSGSVKLDTETYNRFCDEEKSDLHRAIALGYQWCDESHAMRIDDTLLHELGFEEKGLPLLSS